MLHKEDTPLKRAFLPRLTEVGASFPAALVKTGAVHILESTIGSTYMVPSIEVSEIESLKKEFEGQIRSF